MLKAKIKKIKLIKFTRPIYNPTKKIINYISQNNLIQQDETEKIKKNRNEEDWVVE